ncbi:UNVERIFIED_CONTAM: hypothetical protein FKN15_020650 [Acipenser sinensis]
MIVSRYFPKKLYMQMETHINPQAEAMEPALTLGASSDEKPKQTHRVQARERQHWGVTVHAVPSHGFTVLVGESGSAGRPVQTVCGFPDSAAAFLRLHIL